MDTIRFLAYLFEKKMVSFIIKTFVNATEILIATFFFFFFEIASMVSA